MALLAACGGAPADQPDALEGTALVAGTSLSRYGLLVIPRSGGTAEFRAIDDPSTVRWTGRVELPATAEAHGTGRSIVLRDADGAAIRYTPSPEAVLPLGEVPAHARWVEAAGGGAWIASGWALVVDENQARELSAEGEILWASPASGGRAVALIASGAGASLAVWEPGADEPAQSRAVETRGPALVTGWGSEVVIPSPDGGELLAFSLPGLEPVASASIGAPPVALANSPSQHRILAGSQVRPRLMFVNRYAWTESGDRGLDGPAVRIRTATTGDGAIVSDGETLWATRIGRSGVDRIPGAWRGDLPILLAGDAVLTLVGTGLHRYSADGDDLGAVDGPIDAWWIPLRWGPRAPVTAVAVAPEDTVESEETPSGERAVGMMTLGRVSGRTVATVPSGPPSRAAERLPTDAPDAVDAPSLPAGFYAVATSSRELRSLQDLRGALDGSGYSTHVMPRRDEANDLWYRLMVGPYPSRAEAEAAARELRRDRGIDAWIQDIRPGDLGGPRP